MPKKPIAAQDYNCRCSRQEPGPDLLGGLSCHWCLGVIFPPCKCDEPKPALSGYDWPVCMFCMGMVSGVRAA